MGEFPSPPSEETLEKIRDYVKGIVDDSIKGLLRSIGDAGASPTNATGYTVLKQLYDIAAATAAIRNANQNKSAYNSSTASALSVTLALNGYDAGRSKVEVWVKSSAAATFYVQGSRDNLSWRTVDTITFTGADEAHKGYFNAYPYIKVYTSAANDNEIEIVSGVP